MLVSTSGTTTHETSTPPTPPDTPKYLDQRPGLDSWVCQRIERAPLGLAPEATSPPFGDPMTRERFRPHGFLTWRLVIHPQGGKLIKRITAKNPTLWAREQIGNRAAQHEEDMKRLLASAATYLPQRTRRQP
jgi:hypothetical protein